MKQLRQRHATDD